MERVEEWTVKGSRRNAWVLLIAFLAIAALTMIAAKQSRPSPPSFAPEATFWQTDGSLHNIGVGTYVRDLFLSERSAREVESSRYKAPSEELQMTEVFSRLSASTTWSHPPVPPEGYSLIVHYRERTWRDSFRSIFTGR